MKKTKTGAAQHTLPGVPTIVEALTTQLSTVNNHDQLKEFGAELLLAELTPEERTALVKLYRGKRNFLDRRMVQFSRNTPFKRLLYSINTATAETISEIGKAVYEAANAINDKGETVLNKHEADLAFRSYWHQKNKFVTNTDPVPAAA